MGFPCLYDASELGGLHELWGQNRNRHLRQGHGNGGQMETSSKISCALSTEDDYVSQGVLAESTTWITSMHVC